MSVSLTNSTDIVANSVSVINKNKVIDMKELVKPNETPFIILSAYLSQH